MKAESHSIAVPQQDVISRSGFSRLCVLTFPNATPSFGSRFTTHVAISWLICPSENHYNNSEHEISQINFIIIEQIRSFENSLHLEQLLLTREAYWTAQLFTLNPHALNKRRESRSKHRINYYN